LDLVELSVGDNKKIKDVSFMINLKILYAVGSCGINLQSIKGLNIDILDTHGNPNFTKAVSEVYIQAQN
jgi:hypothetical protein